MRFFAAILLCLSLFSCSKESIETESTHSISVQRVNAPAIEVDFKTLASFELPIADPVMADKEDLKFISEALPENVRQLNNKSVKIKGFMLPLEYTKEEKIITFLLMPDQGACCFGKIPPLNGVIFCRSKKAYPDLRDTLLELTGTLTTEPSYNEEDKAVYLYTMKIDSIKELKLMPPLSGPEFSF